MSSMRASSSASIPMPCLLSLRISSYSFCASFASYVHLLSVQLLRVLHPLQTYGGFFRTLHRYSLNSGQTSLHIPQTEQYLLSCHDDVCMHNSHMSPSCIQVFLCTHELCGLDFVPVFVTCACALISFEIVDASRLRATPIFMNDVRSFNACCISIRSSNVKCLYFIFFSFAPPPPLLKL